MAKQYISADSTTFLKTQDFDPQFKISSLVNPMLEVLKNIPASSQLSVPEDIKKAAQEVQDYLNLLKITSNGNSQIGSLEKYEIYSAKNLSEPISPEEFLEDYEALSYSKKSLGISAFYDLQLRQLALPIKLETQYLKPSEKGPKADPAIYTKTQNAVSQFDKLKDYIAATPQTHNKFKTMLSWTIYNYSYSQNPVAELKTFTEKYQLAVPFTKLQELLEEGSRQLHKLESLIQAYSSNFKPTDYRLKNYIPPRISAVEDIENKKAYYVFTQLSDSKTSGFLTLVKTKHPNRTMYEWSLCNTIDSAYLFQAPLEHYKDEIYSLYLTNASKIYVGIDFKEVVSPQHEMKPHHTLEAIKALIDKKDIGRMLDSLPQSNKPQVENSNIEEIVATKKRHKI